MRSDEDVARRYYRELFPSDSVHRWAGRAWAGIEPHKREWGWEGWDGSPFVRWKSCPQPKDLREMVGGKRVGKINLGAVFTTDPAQRHKQREPMKVAAREFVIDIDLTDYPGGSTDLDACDHMWPLVAVGLEVAWRSLTNHFGFRHVLKVYSGRRGGHLWVCDKRACAMNDDARDAIIKWLAPYENKGETTWKYLLEHPNFTEMNRDLVLPFFRETAIKPVEQGGLGMFEIGFQRRAFVTALNLCGTDGLAQKAESSPTPANALELIEAFCGDVPFKRLRFACAVWGLVGPKLDANVSKHANHTLKIPFSVHPKTLRVSVPINHDRLVNFPVSKRAPTVHELFGDQATQRRRVFDCAVDGFNAFVNELANSETERWVPTDHSLTIKRQKVAVHDMRGSPSLESDRVPERLMSTASFPRRAWVLSRSFTAYATDEQPTKVQITMTSTEHDRARHTVAAGNFLPFPHETHSTLDERVESMRSVVEHARRHPGRAWHCFSTSYVTIVGTDPTFDARTTARLDRMAERLREPYQLCEVDTAWEATGLSSYLKQQLGQMLNDVRSIS